MDTFTTLLQIALIFIFGFIGGELINKIKLPRVLGYIIIGMVIGPYALGLVGTELAGTSLFALVFVIVIGFVGLSVGSSINIDEIKEGGKKILIIGLFASFLPFALVSLVMYHVFDFDLYSSLIFGSIALATSPITALSIIKEYKVEGPVQRTLMLLAAIDDAIAIILFGVLISLAGSHYGSGESSLIEPFAELGISIVVGLAAGYIIYLVIKFLARRTSAMYIILSATIVLVFISLFIAGKIHAEGLLVGITAGVVIFNMLEGKERKIFKQATKGIMNLSVIGALVLVGAMLDINSVFSWIAIAGALVYVITRALGCIGGSNIGAKIAGAEKNVQKYLGYTLLAGAGVSLTFAGVAILVIPEEFGVKMGAIIAAAAVINEILAVFTTKMAFKKAGEIGKAEQK